MCYLVTMHKAQTAQAQPIPDLTREAALWNAGVGIVAGIDEAGRGALAGPVVAAAVVLPAYAEQEGIWRNVRDSKLLSSPARADLETEIKRDALAWAIGAGAAAEIDAIGVASATRLAMRRAIEALAVRPAHLLIDWVRLPQVNIAQTCWPKADQWSVSVAAASILAKVHRDRLMCALDATYPQYGFASNKGYGAPRHLDALQRRGPCPEHRRTFAPIAQSSALFDEWQRNEGIP